MVLLMFGLSLVIATAQDQIVGALRANLTQVKRWGGIILILIGLWLTALGIWADAFARLFLV